MDVFTSIGPRNGTPMGIDHAKRSARAGHGDFGGLTRHVPDVGDGWPRQQVVLQRQHRQPAQDRVAKLPAQALPIRVGVNGGAEDGLV